MANSQTPVRQDVDQQASAEVATITDKALLQRFAEMAVMIPAQEGSGAEAILTQILDATSWEDLDSPWEASPLEDVLNRELVLESAKRLPSTFGGGLGLYLVLTLRDRRTGETFTKTTGSISVVGQVCAAYAKGWMPIGVVWLRAERPSANGFYPQHLRITDSYAPVAKDAS